MTGPDYTKCMHPRPFAAIRKDTPWLTWRAVLCLDNGRKLCLGQFPTVDDARAGVRRRGWVHVKPLNFPQPEQRGGIPIACLGALRRARYAPLARAEAACWQPPVGTRGLHSSTFQLNLSRF